MFKFWQKKPLKKLSEEEIKGIPINTVTACIWMIFEVGDFNESQSSLIVEHMCVSENINDPIKIAYTLTDIISWMDKNFHPELMYAVFRAYRVLSKEDRRKILLKCISCACLFDINSDGYLHGKSFYMINLIIEDIGLNSRDYLLQIKQALKDKALYIEMNNRAEYSEAYEILKKTIKRSQLFGC